MTALSVTGPPALPSGAKTINGYSHVPHTTHVGCVEVADWELEQLETAFLDHPELETRLLAGTLPDAADQIDDPDVISTFTRSSVDSGVLDRFPSLGLIATRSSGTDHIDLDACAARGVAVANVPSYGEHTVAEHTFALILALSRRLLPTGWKRRGDGAESPDLQGFDLAGKTLGVIGAGRVGVRVIRIARAFGMDVLASDPREDPLLADMLGFGYANLAQLLRRSEIVSLHVPALPETRHLIDAVALAMMRPGALLVNTAQGSLVDTAALVSALDSEHLAGAALDVYEGEDEVGEAHELLGLDLGKRLRAALGHRLLADRDDVVLTPHNGFNSYEAIAGVARVTADNIAAWRRGRPQNLVGAGEGPRGATGLERWIADSGL
jgi:D-lactate dehydrogenase